MTVPTATTDCAAFAMLAARQGLLGALERDPSPAHAEWLRKTIGRMDAVLPALSRLTPEQLNLEPVP